MGKKTHAKRVSKKKRNQKNNLHLQQINLFKRNLSKYLKGVREIYMHFSNIQIQQQHLLLNNNLKTQHSNDLLYWAQQSQFVYFLKKILSMT